VWQHTDICLETQMVSVLEPKTKNVLPVTSIVLTVVRLCSELLQLLAQSLIGSPSTLPWGFSLLGDPPFKPPKSINLWGCSSGVVRVGDGLKRTKQNWPGPDGRDDSRWYGRLRQKLMFNSGESFHHHSHFLDQFAPPP